MTGVILSGGKCTRMGSNKAFLKINGERLIDRTIRIFRELFSEVMVVTNEPLRYLDLDVEIARDIFPGKGPLGGIFTGLFYATYSHAFISACDMPFINPELIACMTTCRANHDIVVPRTAEGFQPLHAIYARTCMPEIRRLIDGDRLKIIGLYQGFHTYIVGPEVISEYDREGKAFLNVNTPQDITVTSPTHRPEFQGKSAHIWTRNCRNPKVMMKKGEDKHGDTGC